MLKCWDSICTPKSIGGLGFKRSFDMNLSLFAKLAWMIASDQNLFWVKLLKSKYLRGKSFISNDIIACNSSWIWSDICQCRELIREGAIYPVSSLSTISIWAEPWIPSIPRFTPSFSNINPNTLSVSLVRDLIDFSSCSWKLQSLTATFSPSLVLEILKIQISPSDSPKSLVWSPSLSGNFSTKSFYHHSQRARFSNHAPTDWNQIWNFKLHNRHKLLLWRILHNILPNKAKLGDLFPILDPCCFLCNNNVESLDHLFITCPVTQQIWFASFWNFNISTFAHMSISQWIYFIFYKNNKLFDSAAKNHEFILFNVLLFDNVWKYRNSLAHGGSPVAIHVLVKSISRQAELHWLSIVQTLHYRSSTNPWTPPPAGWLKINVDAAYNLDLAHSGCILKNEHGSVCMASVNLHNCLDALTAECLVILEACNFLHANNIKNVIIESDSLNAISYINGSSRNSFWKASPVVEKIKRAWNVWPSWVFKFSPRSSNGAAHALAKWASCNSFVGLIPLSSIPISVFCDKGFPISNKKQRSMIYITHEDHHTKTMEAVSNTLKKGSITMGERLTANFRRIDELLGSAAI
ncbi:hypothetical protein CASFOL_026224 [Castilleja foliolosa]|uniref:Reverse transcriptase zinc-binding domain-containing protein n=1 Tax=Castilleja foliolosa TaxID=1961234 RepID=A0ABD3CMU0_9LAMI